jgi:hypothetical protein
MTSTDCASSDTYFDEHELAEALALSVATIRFNSYVSFSRCGVGKLFEPVQRFKSPLYSDKSADPSIQMSEDFQEGTGCYSSTAVLRFLC